jgi:hypothetical protein
MLAKKGDTQPATHNVAEGDTQPATRNVVEVKQ